MPTDMPKCETCRHWLIRGGHLGHQGRCEAISSKLDQPVYLAVGALAGVLPSPPDCVLMPASLLTLPSFGCIAHQPKEG